MLEFFKNALPFITIINLTINLTRVPEIKQEYLKHGLKESCADIAKKLGVHNVTIKPIDITAHTHWSTSPSDCKSSGADSTIRFDISYLGPESFSDVGNKLLGNPFTINEEGRFIIGHELIHIRDHHYIKRWIAFFAIPFLVNEILPYYNRACDYMVKKFTKTTRLPDSNQISKTVQKLNSIQQRFFNSFFGQSTISFLCYLAYVRSLEKHADLQAAQSLNCARGGIQFFRRKKPTIFDKHLWFLSTYPALAERIAYLENLCQ